MTHFYISIAIIAIIILISFFATQPQTKAEIPQQVKNPAEPILLAKNTMGTERIKVVEEVRPKLLSKETIKTIFEAVSDCAEAGYCRN